MLAPGMEEQLKKVRGGGVVSAVSEAGACGSGPWWFVLGSEHNGAANVVPEVIPEVAAPPS